ncbi:aspartate/glutamate racemase family protein [Oceanimonas doudoroffii]|uniref:Aspartate racemase n=1 Tax=Oceanimonas doudoroffii TaxID=84158 RepID=A0A233RHQ8_9GAMM|nr:amino acid racemase [Oceanimonas doudoroffii]OXY82917.1 aspartate racemase [Oceanimonas doudoroffii]
MSSLIGILGGMGPLATVDFVTKIIHQTPASRDQDHLPLLVHSVPQIPDRTACLLENKESPLEALLKGLNTLISGGAGCIAIPCNTAHYWYEPLAQASSVPILHIARACAAALAGEKVGSVGLLATDGTLKAGFYARELAEFGIALTTPRPELQRRVMEGIYLVKSGAVKQGAQMLDGCMADMLQQGVERVILGCTEIPFALDSIGSAHAHLGMDATRALAAACVQWHRQQQMAVAA